MFSFFRRHESPVDVDSLQVVEESTEQELMDDFFASIERENQNFIDSGGVNEYPASTLTDEEYRELYFAPRD